MRHGWFGLLLFLLPALGFAEFEFDFDVGRYERKPYEVSGYLQGTVEHFLLYRDTDIHLTARASGSRPGALGIALSRNLAPHLEVHAELAGFGRREVAVVNEDSADA